MSIAALTFRLAITSVLCLAASRTVRMTTVHSNDPNDPNKSFAKHSGTSEFEFSVTNPDAFDFLVPGAQYDLVMVPSGGSFAISVVPGSAAVSSGAALDPTPIPANPPVAPVPDPVAPAPDTLAPATVADAPLADATPASPPPAPVADPPAADASATSVADTATQA